MAAKQLLGKLLIEQNLVSRDVIDSALRVQVGGNRRLGHILVRMKAITADQLAETLAKQLDIPITDISQKFSQETSGIIPRYLCRKFSVIPLALKAVEKGGTVLFFAGAAEGATISTPINDIFWRTEATLTSSYAGAPSDCHTALKLIGAGAVPVLDSVTHRLSMAEASKGFQTVSTPADHDCIKVLVAPQT